MKNNPVGVGESKEAENASQVDNKVSGDGWQPAVGKRGRARPSPDKVLKKSMEGAVSGHEIVSPSLCPW